ncbi:MAG: AAA family ATPase, partial [Chloroflexota bacterium]
TLGHLQSALRQASGQAQTTYLSVTHNELALNPDADIHLDLHTVERAYAQARADRSSRTPPEGSASLPLLQSAVACHRGDFLAGLSLGDAPGFDDWAAVQREVWRRRLGLILDRLSEIQFARGELAGTAETASLWIALDALNEVAYRRKMRAHFAAGERGQALETYDACRAALAAELSVEPEPDTEALAERIRTQYPLSHSAPQPDWPDTPVTFLENLFTGRTAEYQALVERYGRAATGQPQVVTLRGEAGIGKTRLAREFLTWAVAQGAETLHGRTFESGSRMSYQPLIEAFRPRLGRENALPDWLGEAWLVPLSQLLPELRERYPDLPLAHLEAPADRTQLFESLVRLTLALANRAPLVLFVDDVQWVDSATLDLLQYAIRRWRESAARILLLVSLRSETLQPSAQSQRPNLNEWLAQVERELEPYHLELEPLGERDTVQMVLSMLAPPAADFAQ